MYWGMYVSCVAHVQAVVGGRGEKVTFLAPQPQEQCVCVEEGVWFCVAMGVWLCGK